ncbi:MAG TPA: TIGR03085 family metal-binding protein [Acidimicrobiales bacterium]|nr:TIGR03085 family metal-binding protein [Acidimicrobiales bacterium]
MSTPTVAQQERGHLCDLFLELGPEAPTLCAGWVTADLAAHLVARERRPDSGPGLVWPPLAGHTDRVRRSVRDGTPWPDLVETVRRGPPLLLRPLDGPMNPIELLIHIEDVRRAQTAWEPRPLPSDLADALWARLGAGAMAKRIAGTVELVSTGHGTKESGTGPRIVITGDPGELTLFGAGRQGAARVEMTGDAELAAQLRAASLGI